jgi:hypothetical protein
MSMNLLASASDLSDHDLLARLAALAVKEREATVELVAHLAALDARPALYAAHGFGSLFGYCTQALGLVEALVAELAPRPDVPSSVRKVPTRAVATPVAMSDSAAATVPADALRPPLPPMRRPIIENTSPERYRVQFTIGKGGHDTLRRLQELLRREVPDGDPGAIVERALTVLLAKVERDKLGAASKPRPIRPGTDSLIRTPIVLSRDIPNGVKRAASRRDGGQCAYVAPDGRRCTERTLVEFHHVWTRAKGGPATVGNISLRCRRHNQYEAELVFGPRRGRRDTKP